MITVKKLGLAIMAVSLGWVNADAASRLWYKTAADD